MMGSSTFEEADSGGYFVDGGIDSARLARAVTNLARSTTDTESILLLLSSIRFNQEEGRERRNTNDKFQTLTRKRQSEDQRAEKGDGNKRARRTVDKNEKSAKGSLVQIEAFECEHCERYFATGTALKTHRNSCAQATDAPKSTKYKCALCHKERSNIYIHYASIHVIEYPEQIMFYKGNVLVRSDIDTKGGKAPWFEREEEKAMTKYDNLTCRLCVSEPKFDNTEILADHYTLYHMVAPVMLDNLKKLFRAEKGAHLVDLPTSQTPSKRKGAASSPTSDKLNSNYDTGKSRWPCKQCKREYSTSGNLARHVKLAHLEKKPEEVVGIKVVSDKNKNEKNTSKAEAKREPKSEKSKCVFCDKELTTIYKHYGNIHNIEYPEELLFFNSNVLVISDIDTKGGKAPWFLREAEKAKRYTPNTCRLCETEYDELAVLENHYRSDHKVIPGALERLQHLFRAEKGAHLADMPASRAPSKQQKSTLRPPQGEPLSRGLVKNTNGYVSAAEHNNQKPEQEIEKQGATTNTKLQNVQNDSRMIENSAAGPEQGNRQPIQIIEDIVVSVFCDECNKSIMYSNFEAHAATHKNNQYVAEEADCSQIIEENTTQAQRSPPGKEHEKSQYDPMETVEGNCDGTVEPWDSDKDSCHSLRTSSYVVQVDVHVERDETEELNHSHQSYSSCGNSKENCDKANTAIEETSLISAYYHQEEQNSETDSMAIQAQDTEGLEERDAFSKGLKEDLERSLQILLGDEENDICVNKSTSDNCCTQLRDILETNTTGQETSEMDNDREQVHAVIQNDNDEIVVHSRNDTDLNISQDIFTSEPSEIHRENNETCELSQDMFSGTTLSQEHVDIAENTDDINKSNANETTSENDQGNDGNMQPNPRPSTRDIIRSLLEDTTSGFNADTEEERRNEEKRKIDQQRLIDETRRIRDIMLSRDENKEFMK